MGDDHLNPALRPSVQQLINKLNQMNVMQDPVNRRYILIRLLAELTVVDLARVLSAAHAQFSHQLWTIPLFADIAESDESFEAYIVSQGKKVLHGFDPLPSRKNPGKKLNRCKVCGNPRQHFYHSEAP